MGGENAVDDENRAPGRELRDYVAFARAHGDTGDSRQVAEDLEDMLRVAWEIMTPEQRDAFREHADILALEEAVGGGMPAAG